MTDEAILEEFYLTVEYEKLLEDNRKLFEPHCPECKYVGEPVANTIICPDCGAEMILPDETEVNQTTASDDDQVASLEELGITISEKDKRLIRSG